MNALKTQLVEVDTSVFSKIPPSRKIVIRDIEVETGRSAKASISRLGAQKVRLQYTDWHGVKCVVLLDLEGRKAELAMPYLGRREEVKSLVRIVMDKCLRYMRNDEIVD